MTMPFWKYENPAIESRTVIARIEGSYDKGNSSASMFFLVVGAIAMIIAVFIETSAMRLAAWGTIWTGWNVLFGIGVLNSGGSIRYVVYRETPPA
jgi:hypothetical protein